MSFFNIFYLFLEGSEVVKREEERRRERMMSVVFFLKWVFLFRIGGCWGRDVLNRVRL